MSSNMILLLMFGSLTLFMLSGLPIAFVLGGLSLLFTVTLWEPNAVIVLVLQIFDTMKSEALLAIPLFILMACILQRSGVIEDLYRQLDARKSTVESARRAAKAQIHGLLTPAQRTKFAAEKQGAGKKHGKKHAKARGFGKRGMSRGV